MTPTATPGRLKATVAPSALGSVTPTATIVACAARATASPRAWAGGPTGALLGGLAGAATMVALSLALGV